MNTDFLGLMGKLVVYVFGIMGLVFIIALLTPKMAAWIDDRKEKNKDKIQTFKDLNRPVKSEEEERKYLEK